MKITKIRYFHVQTDVKLIVDGGIAPYAGSQDDVGVTTAQSLLVRLDTDEGISGWGEMNTGFGPGVDKALVETWMAPILIGQDPTEIRKNVDRLDSPYWPQLGRRSLACAVEMAMWDILGKSVNRPISTLLGGRLRDQIPVAFCLGITSPQVGAEIAKNAYDAGWRVFKTKIGVNPVEDVQRVAAITEATGGNMTLRLDANQGLTRTEALQLLPNLESFPIEYIEQPLAVTDYQGHKTLKNRTTIPIAINEDAYMYGGVARGIQENSIDAAVVDIEGAGGVSGLMDLSAVGAAFNIPLAHHCGWDFGVKAAMMLQVVSAAPGLNLASDSTYAMHLDDVLEERLHTHDGEMQVPNGPGLGANVDELKVERLGT